MPANSFTCNEMKYELTDSASRLHSYGVSLIFSSNRSWSFAALGSAQIRGRSFVEARRGRVVRYL